MVTLLRSGQEMLYKYRRGLIQTENKVELRFLCIARRVIAKKHAYQVWSHLNLW
jgi:hypothetical protein